MEEILIEEKKYVSSKRAAKITGYAKDYIGQLCREGRVPARLVGRGWYVLESAIQDHRFGKETEPKESVTPAPSTHDISSDTREEQSLPTEAITFPRYEAAYTEMLPALNRLENAREMESPDTVYEDQKGQKSIAESWDEWFEHVRVPLSVAGTPVQKDTDATSATVREKEEISQTEKVPIDVFASVPIHVVRAVAPEVKNTSRKDLEEHEDSTSLFSISHKAVWAIRVVGVSLAIVSVALSLAGSGYLDNYIISHSQFQSISGVSVYLK